MNRLGLTAGVIFALAAALALWVLRSERAGKAAELLAPQAGPNEPGEESRVVSSSPITARSGQEAPLLEISVEPESRRESLLAVKNLPRRVESTLRIVDGTTGDPLPGAWVRWADMIEVNRFRGSDIARREWTEADILEHIGRVDSADARGFVRVPRELTLCSFTARSGELSATEQRYFREGSRITTTTEEYVTYRSDELLLFPDRTLEIQVVDSAGMPRAGIDVCLRVEGLSFQSEIWGGTTGAEDGIALIEHADSLLAEFYKSARRGKPGELYADFGFMTRPPAGRRIDPQRWPNAPIQLELPGIGSLRVTVLDRSGEPTKERVKVYVDATDPGEVLRPRIGEGDLEQGSIRFGSIQYGLRLGVSVSFYGRRGSIRREIPGPDPYQKDLELTIHESAPTPLIGARPLDGKGQPMRNRAVMFRFTSRNAQGDTLAAGSQALMTDADGRFETQLLCALYPQGSCSIRLSADGFYAEQELTSDLAFERIELGDLRLDREEGERLSRAR